MVPGQAARTLCSPVVLDVLLHLVEAHRVAQGQVVGAGLYRGAPVHLWGVEESERLETRHTEERMSASFRNRAHLGAGLPGGGTAWTPVLSVFIYHMAAYFKVIHRGIKLNRIFSSLDKQTFAVTWKAQFKRRILGFPGVLHPAPRSLSPQYPCLHACRHPAHVSCCVPCPTVNQPLVIPQAQVCIPGAGHSQEDRPGQAVLGSWVLSGWSTSRGMGSEWAHSHSSSRLGSPEPDTGPLAGLKGSMACLAASGGEGDA